VAQEVVQAVDRLHGGRADGGTFARMEGCRAAPCWKIAWRDGVVLPLRSKPAGTAPLVARWSANPLGKLWLDRTAIVAW
jgi:hypothetical protein